MSWKYFGELLPWILWETHRLYCRHSIYTSTNVHLVFLYVRLWTALINFKRAQQNVKVWNWKCFNKNTICSRYILIFQRKNICTLYIILFIIHFNWNHVNTYKYVWICDEPFIAYPCAENIFGLILFALGVTNFVGLYFSSYIKIKGM